MDAPNFWTEADIVINGQKINFAQSMTIRVALGSFYDYLKENGLGNNSIGISIAEGYKKCIEELFDIIIKK